MKESIIERTIKPLPVPFEEFEEFSTPMQEFFDLVARRPFELLGATPRFFTRELENWLKPEPEVFRPVNLKLYETEEALIVRAEVPGFTEKELDINVEPWRLILTAKKDYTEEKKELVPVYKEKLSKIYRTVKFPIEVRPEAVKAILKNGILEVTLPKAEVVKKIHVEVKPL
jgi:HSP20 family protein